MTFSPIFSHINSSKIVFSIHTAIVVNNNDPLQLSRVQARISLLHQGYQDSQLPWFVPFAFSPSGNTATLGSIYVPVNGASIGCLVAENDPTYCFYIGSTVTQANANSALLQDYPATYGFIDAAGNLCYVNTASNACSFNTVDGSYIFMQNGTLNIMGTSVLNINISGNCNINASGAVNISGSSVNLSPSSNPASSLQSNPQTKPSIPDFAN